MPDYLMTITTKVPAAEGSETKEITVERAVAAKNEARAIKHIVKDTISVMPLTRDDIVRLTKAGVEIEQAE